MKFYFKAKNEKGEIKEGKVEAINEETAVSILQSSQLIPILIEQENKKVGLNTDLKRIWEGVKPVEIAVFFRQFSTLVDAKVSIVSALQAIEEQMDNKYLKEIILGVVKDVQDGMPLSEALGKNSSVFTPLMVNMVRAGEVSGNLQRSLAFIADNTEKNQELTSKIKSALAYPGFVLGSSVLIGFLVFSFVLPKLTGVFKDLEVEIPWHTKILMTVGDFMSTWWWAILILLVGIVMGIVYYFKTEEGRKEFDQFSIKIPIVGNLFKYIYISRFAENLSVLLAGGIPIVRALMIVSDVVGNSLYQALILKAADEVKKGGSISSIFMRSTEIPPIVSRMIKIGEETGKISDVLKNISEFYNRETDRITRNFSSLIEPVLILFLGIGVAVLVFSILMPIYSMAGQIQ